MILRSQSWTFSKKIFSRSQYNDDCRITNCSHFDDLRLSSHSDSIKNLQCLILQSTFFYTIVSKTISRSAMNLLLWTDKRIAVASVVGFHKTLATLTSFVCLLWSFNLFFKDSSRGDWWPSAISTLRVYRRNPIKHMKLRLMAGKGLKSNAFSAIISDKRYGV